MNEATKQLIGKTYSSRSNAARALKKAAGENWQDQVQLKPVGKKEVKVLAKTNKGDNSHLRGTSTVEEPCSLVWDIAEAMKGAPRKEVMAQAMAQGVTYYTARTQYQLWRATKKQEQSRKS